ncbi:hypothetical protein [Pseudoneobacillus sp. C159]
MLSRIFKRKRNTEDHDLLLLIVPFELKPYMKTDLSQYFGISKSEPSKQYVPFLF